MKYCINCGHVLPDFANFCSICGQKQFSVDEEDVQDTIPNPIEETPVVEEIKETISEEPVVEPVVLPNETSEEVIPEPVEEPQQQEEQPKNENKKGSVKDFKALFTSESAKKQTFIFLGALLGLSLLLWLLSLAVVINVFPRVLLFIFSLISLARIGYILFLEIKNNKLNNLFDLMLKGTFAIAHLLLFILNFIWMVS